MSSSEQYKKVVSQLASDETWKEVSPEIQKKLLDEHQYEYAREILENHIDAVHNENKKKRAPRKRGKKEDDGEQK